MKKSMLVLFTFIILAFASCSNSTDSTSDGISIYYFKNSNKDALISKSVSISDDNTELKVKRALELLYSPKDDSYLSVFSSGLKHTSFSISDSVCTINLPSQYLTLPPASRIAIDSALVKTLCSINTIDSVVILCDDINKTYSENDIVLTTPKIYYSTKNVNLYFTDKNFETLKKLTRNVPIQSGKSLEYSVVSALFNNPASKNLQTPIPKDTKLNSVYVADGICYIDLSPEFIENAIHTKEGESVIIYSIVNTVTELPLINSVKFLIDGSQAYGFIYYDISVPLTNKSDLFES